MNKKGFSDTTSLIGGVILALLFIAIIFGITFQLSDKFKENISDTTGTVTNETISDIVNGTTYTLGYNYSKTPCWNKNYFSIDAVYNQTGVLSTDIINSGNYTYSNLGTITPTSEYAYSSDTNVWKVSYTYRYATTDQCNAMMDTASATSSVPTWLVIFVLILIAGIILGMLGKFGGNKTTAQI